jgi:hydrogenase maturation protease
MAARIVVAGVGNIFFGDDAFGVEVAHRLAQRSLPAAVRVLDVGIRGLDLAYALLDDCAGAILIDTVQRGGLPGTLYVLEPCPESLEELPPGWNGHAFDLRPVFRLVRMLGGQLPWMRLVGCEPANCGCEDELSTLSEAVAAAVEPAVEQVLALVHELLAEMREGPGRCMS